MRYYACTTKEGPVVALYHRTLGAVISCECLTYRQAVCEAERLNREDEARAIVERVKCRPARDGARRGVRFFANEDVHG